MENLDIEGPTRIVVPGYQKKVEFGFMYDFDYPILNSGIDEFRVDLFLDKSILNAISSQFYIQNDYLYGWY